MIYRFTFFVVYFLASFSFANAQEINLVPNGGFEERSDCPLTDSAIENAPPWFNPCTNPFQTATPDIFHACAVINTEPCPYPENPNLNSWLMGTPVNFLGCEESYEGVGYAGIFFFYTNPDFDTGWREYLAVRLIEPMVQGLVYEVSFQASLAEKMTHAVWNLDVLLSPDSLEQLTTTFMPYTPQLTGTPGEFVSNYDGWREMYWEYTATGGEQYMYIGNFLPNQETDTLRTLVGSTQSHYLPGAYYFIDDVRVVADVLTEDSKTPELAFKLFPIPANNLLSVNSSESGELQIFNLQGNLIAKFGLLPGEQEFNIAHLAEGIYSTLMISDEYAVTNKLVVKR